MLDMKTTDNGVLFTVKVVPGSSRTALAGMLGGMVKIKVAAAPEKGRANECLVDYLAGLLGVRTQQISILAGHTSPVKQVRVDGVEPRMVQGRLEPQKP